MLKESHFSNCPLKIVSIGQKYVLLVPTDRWFPFILAKTLTTLLLCLKSTSNDRFLRSFFIAGLITLRVFARNLLKESRRRNIFIFSFCCLTWSLNSGLASTKPTNTLHLHYKQLLLQNIECGMQVILYLMNLFMNQVFIFINYITLLPLIFSMFLYQ